MADRSRTHAGRYRYRARQRRQPAKQCPRANFLDFQRGFWQPQSGTGQRATRRNHNQATRILVTARRKRGDDMATTYDTSGYLIAPNPDNARLTRRVQSTDHTGTVNDILVVEERPLTIFLNQREIVTAMTIGDYPEYLALGFLRNQGMLHNGEEITGVDYDDEIETVVVRTQHQTDFEEKLKKKTRTSGCAVGTVFGDMMEQLDGLVMPKTTVRTSWLYALADRINRTPSLYLSSGAIHGTVLCSRDQPLVYMEDVGRHNAVDKIAGWMLSENVSGADKILYTTGRLTS